MRKWIGYDLLKYRLFMSVVAIMMFFCVNISVFAEETEIEEIQMDMTELLAVETQLYEEETVSEKTDTYYTIQLEGTKQYDLAVEILNEVNFIRAENDLIPLVLDAELQEEIMLYAAEMTVADGSKRPNGADNSTLAAWITDEMDINEIAYWIINYSVTWQYEDCTAVGIGCFYYDGYYYVTFKLEKEAGTASTKTEAEPGLVEIQMSMNHSAWVPVERNIYLEQGESGVLSVNVGYSEDGVNIEGSTIRMSPSMLTWSSENSAIASVSSEGIVTGMAYGRTTISASFGGKVVCEWNVGVDLSDLDKSECVTIKVSGIKHYEHVIQSLEWINEWRQKEGLEPVTLNADREDVAWQQAIASAVRVEKSPSTNNYLGGTLCTFTGGCGYGAQYYRWMHDTSYDVLNPDYKSVTIACFQNEHYYHWNILWSTDEGTAFAPPDKNIYVHEDVLILKDYLTYVGDPAGKLAYFCDETEQLKIYQGFWEDGYDSLERKALVDSSLITWKSSEPSVVSVNSAGEFITKKVGDAVITASVGDKIIYQWNVNVKVPVVPMEIQVTYNGPEAYDKLSALSEEEKYACFTVVADGVRLGMNDFCIVEYGCGADDVLDYFVISFMGDFTGQYRYDLKKTDDAVSEIPFIDVPSNKWFYNAVKWVYKNGLLTGTGDTSFSPDGQMTRGMLVTVLYRKEGRPIVEEANKFPDVNKKKYYASAIAWSSAENLVSGYSNGEFGPEDNITREQIAKILYLYAKYKGYDVIASVELSEFHDASQVSYYAKKYMQWAVAEGLIQGSNGKLNPKGNATRAEISAILKRFVEKYE